MPYTALFVGLSTIDITYLVDNAPASNEKLTAKDLLLVAGGPASNAAVTCAYLGGEATLVSSLGNSPLSQIALQELLSHKLSVIDVSAAETRTILADPERFPLIRAAWDRMLTGAYTVPEVVGILNDEWGYITRPSKRTVPAARQHGGGPLSLPSAYKLFHNPYYTGHFVVSGGTTSTTSPIRVCWNAPGAVAG